MELFERIKTERTTRMMSQDDLANLLHVSRQAVSKWETGQSYPDLDKLLQLSDLFNISLDELVRKDKKLEKKLIKDGGNRMSGVTILSCVLMVLGVLVILFGASIAKVNLLESAFMCFFVSGWIMIAIGVNILNDIPIIIKIGVVALTVIFTILLLISFHMPLLILLASITVIVGIGVWVVSRIMR